MDLECESQGQRDKSVVTVTRVCAVTTTDTNTENTDSDILAEPVHLAAQNCTVPSAVGSTKEPSSWQNMKRGVMGEKSTLWSDQEPSTPRFLVRPRTFHTVESAWFGQELWWKVLGLAKHFRGKSLVWPSSLVWPFTAMADVASLMLDPRTGTRAPYKLVL